jgi:hypothetical protein
MACGKSRRDGDASPPNGSKEVASIIDATLRTKPEGMTRWSCRLVAASLQLADQTPSLNATKCRSETLNQSGLQSV